MGVAPWLVVLAVRVGLIYWLYMKNSSYRSIDIFMSNVCSFPSGTDWAFEIEGDIRTCKNKLSVGYKSTQMREDLQW